MKGEFGSGRAASTGKVDRRPIAMHAPRGNPHGLVVTVVDGV